MLSTRALSNRLPLSRERAATLLDSLDEYRLYVVANRGPVHHTIADGHLQARQAAGGLVTALTSVSDYFPITWIAAPEGAGDRLAGEVRHLGRPLPGEPQVRYALATEDALAHSYQHFSNPILWFLQHGMYDRLQPPSLACLESGWTLGYQPVNQAFARAIEQEISRIARPIVLTQDYHLYLLPSLLRQRRPDALIQHFNHIPWPAPAHWRHLPRSIRADLHRGLLGADIVGFQTIDSVHNFLRTCELFVPEARIDRSQDAVWLRGRRTRVRAYPISVDPASLHRLSGLLATRAYVLGLKPQPGRQIVVRVDRMDPSKNIALGFRAFGLLLERRPDLVGHVRFLAFLVPSREGIPEYRSYAEEVRREVERVNARFGRDGWRPVELFYEDNRLQAIAGMAVADVVLVNPIADGMNLVAKEAPLVSERDSVLVLSKSCGAYRQLAHGALGVEPADLEGTANALERALEMHPAERLRRITALRAAIESEDLAWWVRSQLTDLFDG